MKLRILLLIAACQLIPALNISITGHLYGYATKIDGGAKNHPAVYGHTLTRNPETVAPPPAPTPGEFAPAKSIPAQKLREVTFIILMRRTNSAKYKPDKTYNNFVLNSPAPGDGIPADPSTHGLLSTTGEEYQGLQFILVGQFSNGSNLGPNKKGRYPAGAIDNFFYPGGIPSREVRFAIPPALQDREVKVTVLGGATTAVVHVLKATVNGDEQMIADVKENVSSVLQWGYNVAGHELPKAGSSLSIFFTQSPTGFCPMNAVEITFRIPAQ